MYIGFDNFEGSSALETGIAQTAGDQYYHPFCNVVDANGKVTPDSSQNYRTYSKNQDVKRKAEITSYNTSTGYATVQVYINDVKVLLVKTKQPLKLKFVMVFMMATVRPTILK